MTTKSKNFGDEEKITPSQQLSGRERFFYVPLPKAMGEDMDRLLDRYGDKLSLLSRNDLVRAGTREYMEKIRKEYGEY